MSQIQTIQKFIRRSVNKGTNTITEPEQSQSAWCGTEFRKQEQNRAKLAKSFYIMSARGTKIVDHSKMSVPELSTLPKGFRFSSSRGTSTRPAI